MKKRLTGLLLAILMLASLFVAGIQPAVADSAPIDQEIVQGGAILHCFDWSFKEIEANLADIKEAGYVAVQTSPVQPAKDYNAAWCDTGGNWWKLYQPLGFRVAGESETWLGTKEELAELCETAEEYGIYVIVDIVANHVANNTGGGYTVNGVYNVSKQVDDVLQDRDGSKGYYHTSENGTNDESRYTMTQYHLSMPDLNTGNDDIQEMVLDLLKECVDCGVDGFRFDAAKHIELPNDPGCGSDFWPTVLNGVRDYAASKNRELYIYGESLSGSGTDSWVGEFITYMALTDNGTGNTARVAVCNQNAGALAVGDYQRGSYPKDYVLWAESHDTYLEDNGTRGIPSEKIIRTWAIVGARANSTALFLARPNELMGKASTDTSWKSPAVAAVNQFKTHYDGTGEYFSFNQEAKVTCLERGEAGNGAGVVVAKLDGAGWVENLTMSLMSDGVYKDSVSGNIFAVQNGKLRGTVGPTGVAVVYKTSAEAAPNPPSTSSQMLYLKPNSNWLSYGARFAVYTFGGDEHWYSMTEVDATEHIYGAEITNPYTNVIFCRMNPDTAENTWSNRWTQTENLTVPSDKNLFVLTENEQNWSSGTWDVYGSIGGGVNPTPVTEDEGYYVVGTMTGWSILPAYKMTRTAAQNVEEYMLDVQLLRTSSPAFHSQFKVVYSPDGVTMQTWFPGGENNNYGDLTGEIPMSGIYTVYFRPNYDGEEGWHVNCIYAERTKYFVTVDTMDKNGTVTVDKDVAAEGETVYVTATPNAGCTLESLVYMCETGLGTGKFDTYEIVGNSFQMPAENATVKATFYNPNELNLADGYYLVEDANPTAENINPTHKLELFTDLDEDGHIFNAYTYFAVTGEFGAKDYRIVQVEDDEIVPYDFNQPAPVVTTTGATETVYLCTEPAGAYTWINEYGSGVSGLSGYFLDVGNAPVPELTADDAFAETGTAGLYLFEGVLYYTSIFVCKLENGRCVARYPAGSYDETTTTAVMLDGDLFGWGNFERFVRVWFRPDGQGTPVGTSYNDNTCGKWFYGYFMYDVLFRVFINDSEHGTVTVNKTLAHQNDTITLTITPDADYSLDELTVVNDYWEPVEVTNNSFTMPMYDVKVTATFKSDPSYSVTVDPSIANEVTASPTSAHAGDTVQLSLAQGADFCKLQIRYVLDGVTKTEDVTGNSFTMPAANVTVLGVAHAYGEPTYTWNETFDGYSVTAEAVCANNASHVLTETVDATYEVVVPATFAREGVGRYTATFTDPHFTTQTMNVAIPKLTMRYYGSRVKALDSYVIENGEILCRYDIRVDNLPGGAVSMDGAQIFLTYDHSKLTLRRLEGPVAWLTNENGDKLFVTWASMGSVNIADDDIVLTLYFAWDGDLTEDTVVDIQFTENLLGSGSTLSYLNNGNIVDVRMGTQDGSILLEVPLLGDANCDGRVTAADASLVLRALVGSETLTLRGALLADVDLDRSVTAIDAVQILRYIVGLIEGFPMEAN